MVCTGLEKSPSPNAAPLRALERISSGVQKCRVMGSAALDLCHVAAGRADGYFESGIYLWDIAAAGLMVERAGGRTETLRTLPGHRYSYAATNGLIHEAFTKLLAPVLPPE
jgi:myo-inositol-1(or 4)-monophosphatase